MALTEKQKRFADEYLIDLNATQAAIRAGYSEKTAHSIGAENLIKPDIQSYLHQRQKRLQNKLEITQEKVLAELAHIAFDDIKNYLDFYADDKALSGVAVNIKDSREIDTRNVSEISIGANGQFKFKLYCKDNALVQLGKHLGMFRDGAVAPPDEKSNGLLEAIQTSALEVWNDVQDIQPQADADNDMVETSDSE